MYCHRVVYEVDLILILPCSLSTEAATTCQGGAPQQSDVQLPKGKVLKLRSSTLCCSECNYVFFVYLEVDITTSATVDVFECTPH